MCFLTQNEWGKKEKYLCTALKEGKWQEGKKGSDQESDKPQVKTMLWITRQKLPAG